MDSCPKAQMNIIMEDFGSKAQDKGDSGNHVVCRIPMLMRSYAPLGGIHIEGLLYGPS